MNDILPHVKVMIGEETTNLWSSIDSILAALLSNDLIVAKSKEYGIDLEQPLYHVEFKSHTEEDEAWMCDPDNASEESIQPENLPMLVLIDKNVSDDIFHVGDVYMGTIQGIPVIAHVWDFTGLAIYANKC